MQPYIEKSALYKLSTVVTMCGPLDSHYIEVSAVSKTESVERHAASLQSASFHQLRRVARIASQMTDCSLPSSVRPSVPRFFFVSFTLCSVRCPPRFCRCYKHRRHCVMYTENGHEPPDKSQLPGQKSLKIATQDRSPALGRTYPNKKAPNHTNFKL